MSRKMHHFRVTVDGRTRIDRPLKPLCFVAGTLIAQRLHILAGSPKLGKS